jgi:hypothetical protein
LHGIRNSMSSKTWNFSAEVGTSAAFKTQLSESSRDANNPALTDDCCRNPGQSFPIRHIMIPSPHPLKEGLHGIRNSMSSKTWNFSAEVGTSATFKTQLLECSGAANSQPWLMTVAEIRVNFSIRHIMFCLRLIKEGTYLPGAVSD